MDINSFTGMLASRLVAEGADREAAVRHSSAFVASLPPDEAAKIAALCEHSEDATSRIVASLKKRIDMQQRQTRQAQPVQKQQPTQMMPAQKKSAESQTPAQPQQQRQPQQNQRQAQPIEHVRRMPAHLIDEDDDDDMINEFLAPGGGRQDAPVQNQTRVRRTPQAVRQQPIPQKQPSPQKQSNPQQQRPQQRQQPVRAQQGQQPNPQNVRRQSQPVRTTNGTRPRRPQQENAEKKTIYRPDPNADYQKFYLIFACTSPLWGFIALCVLGLFIIALAVMFVGIFVLIGLLFVGVAAGTVVALIGIIYGITQLFEYAPIGLYEIGLGIRVGGFVMLGGIIVYNTAVRLLPYLIRRELDLFTFVVHKCVELYYLAKGACADL